MALKGCIRVPSDKSISHRAVLFSALAGGTSHLEHVLASDDVRSSLAAVEALGADVDMHEEQFGLSVAIEGIGARRSRGTDPARPTDDDPAASATRDPAPRAPLRIDCGNSGTTTRLLMGILAGLGADAVLDGDASLRTRPMERVMEPLREMGAAFESRDGCLPVHVLAPTSEPAPGPTASLKAVTYRTKQASAQVKSAILLAGLFTEGITSVIEPAPSRDHTERLLPAFGVDVVCEGLRSSIFGPAKLHAHDMAIPGDPSSAAFIAVAACLIEGSDVRICDVALNPTRIGALEVLREMGCPIAYENVHEEGAEPVGDIVVSGAHARALNPVIVGSECIPSLIDEIPILSVAAACADGETIFEGAGELRVKESDRFAGIIAGLGLLGIQAWGEGDDLHIAGRGTSGPAPALATAGGPPSPPAPASTTPASPSPPATTTAAAAPVAFETFGDHRMAMTWYLASCVFGCEAALDDAECVSVSWPGFFDDIASLQKGS